MLVQLPRDTSDQQSKLVESGGDPFEAGLRRDLAMASVVSYEPVLGGWKKRTFDLLISLVTLPIWLPAVLCVAGWSRLTLGAGVISAEECVGYAGRPFRRLMLRTGRKDETPPEGANDVESLNGLEAIADKAEQSRAKWERLLSKLPQFFNVLAGDMSLVGAEPLTSQGLEQLRSAKRYYISARPGIFDIVGLVQGDQSESRFKAYALSWSVAVDLLLIWEGISGFRKRGALWRPGFRLHRVVPGLEADQNSPATRRRSVP
jgi:lipopolysaccharide/colanic/teichoic acid biosynthesis glycosyltransferase